MSKVGTLPVTILAITAAFLTLNLTTTAGGNEHNPWRHRNRLQMKDVETKDFFSVDLCSSCPPGFGVTRRCTRVKDTMCHSCPLGYFAPNFSKKHACWPCSHCGKGLYAVTPCTGTSDTICDACTNGPFEILKELKGSVADSNLNYHRQCRTLSGSDSLHPKNSFSTRIHLTNSQLRTASTVDDLVGGAASSFTDTLISVKDNNLENLTPTSRLESNDDEVALGVAQLAAFQVVLIFTAVAAILALTCRLRVCSYEPARLKVQSEGHSDGVALIENLSEP